MMYNSDDIAIVSYGCFLPNSETPEKFWGHILNGQPQFKKITKERWDPSIYYSKNSKNPLSHSKYASFVENKELDEIKEKLNITEKNLSRLQIMTLHSLDQNLKMLSPEIKNISCDFSVGCMHPDEDFLQGHFFNEMLNQRKNLPDESSKKKWDEKSKKFKKEFNPYITDALKIGMKKYGLKGEAIVVDAACASSHAAISLGAQKLKDHSSDFIICGGIETNLDPISFISFSILDALSPEHCLPFDKNAKGLVQGEGVVFFGLQRIEDALRMKHQIFGILKGIGSSSDGRSTSLFAPSVNGQIQAYKQAFKNIPSPRVDYVECHGTGTDIGDKTELESLSHFFLDYKIPFGSVKALYGHTRGAAGSVGLLKSLLILKEKVIPGSPYFKKYKNKNTSPLFINKKPIKLKKRRHPYSIGISSFGFGGANYHLYLEEYLPEKKIKKISKPESSRALINSSISIDSNILDSSIFSTNYFISEKSIKIVDELQKLSLLATEEALRITKLNLKDLDSSRISVISASNICLKSMINFSNNIKYLEVLKEFENNNEIQTILQKRRTQLYPHPNEDTAPGILNNIISGRVANYFDLKGKNFNIDAGENSYEAALKTSVQELNSKESDLVILLWNEDEKFHCQILSEYHFALEKRIPLLKEVKSINYDVNSNNYQLTLEPYYGPDFSKVCFLLAGQGVSYPQMYKNEIKEIPDLKELFLLCDKLALKFNLHKKISDYIFNPKVLTPNEQDIYKNISLFTLQVGLGRLLIKQTSVPEIITAHSFGEYAGLVLSGIAKFENIFEFLVKRETWSPAPFELGKLIAINTSSLELEKLLTKNCFYVCNYNSKKQTVIAVTPDNFDSVESTLMAKKVGYKVLENISQPYHCPLMDPLSKRLRNFLDDKKYKFSPPTIEFYSSVLNQRISNHNFKKINVNDILSNQINHPVIFKEQIEKINSNGLAFSFIEIGPRPGLLSFLGNILESESYKILPLKDQISLSTPNVRIKKPESKDIKKLGILKNIIKKVTGYNIENISLEDKLEENLGIDSIKKVELVFQILKDTVNPQDEDLNIAKIKTVEDAIDLLEDGKRKTKNSFSNNEFQDSHSIYMDDWIASPPLYSINDNVVSLQKIDFELLWSNEDLKILPRLKEKTILLDAFKFNSSFINRVGLEKGIRNFIRNWKELYKNRSNERLNLCLLFSDEEAPLFGGINAFFKSFSKEENDFFYKPILYQDSKLINLFEIIYGEMESPIFEEIKIESDKRYIKKYTKFDPKVRNEPSSINKILCIGGASGVTYEILKDFPNASEIELFLIGRRSPRDSFIKNQLRTLKEKFRTVHYTKGNATNRSDLEKLIISIHGKDGIDLIINGASEGKSSNFLNKSLDDFLKEIKTKIEIIEHLNALSKNYNFKRIINFGSIIGSFGMKGDTSYAFANGFLNKMTSYHKDGICINWPAWNNIGMTKNLAVIQNLTQMGVSFLNREEGLRYFHQLMAIPSNIKSVIIMENKYPWVNSKELHNLNSISQDSISTLKFPALKDHRINESCLYPAAFSLANFLTLAKTSGQRNYKLENFEIPNPLLIDSEPQEIKNIIVRKKNHLEYLTFGKIIHFKCIDNLDNFTELPSLHPQQKGADWEIFKKEDIYKKGALFHGPKFQYIDQISIKNQRAFINIQMETEKTNLEYLLESSFQLLAFLGLKKTARSILPSSIEAIYFCPNIKLNSKILIECEITKIESKNILGNIQIISEGETFLFLEKVSLGFI